MATIRPTIMGAGIESWHCLQLVAPVPAACECGRLPCTIGADKASDGPGRDADGEAIDCFALPVVLTQAMGFDRRGTVRRVIRQSVALRGIGEGGHDHLQKELGVIPWCGRCNAVKQYGNQV